MTGLALLLPTMLLAAAIALFVLATWDATHGGLTAHEERDDS